MPRKVNYGVDFDQEDYGVYEDYDDDFYDDYDQDSDVEGYEEASKVAEASKIDQATTKPGLWRCPMCTFDNAESLSACDICGVFRVPLVNNNGNKETVYDGSKGPGASILAKSLFAPLPRRTLKKAVLFQQKKDDLASNETYNFHRIGNIQAPFKFDSVPPGDLASSGNHSTKKVFKAPFKFDSVPPGDLASSGNHSTKKVFKANIVGPAPSTTSSSTVGKKEKANKLPSIDTVESSSNLVRNVVQSTSDESSSSSVNSLTKNFDKVNFDADPGVSQNGINTKKPTLRTQYKPEKWMLPDQEGKLTQLNLAIVGHVDSGKSTLSGRLLSLLGRISAKEMHKYQKESKLQGKGSFAYAWAMDESTEERERGITMTVGVAYFQSKKYHVVLLDSPGHKDFVPNMISGATQADAAILVIDASIGSFEAGIDANGGQTREHAQLIRSFGVDQVIIAINKMDAVDYSMERFDSIKLQLGIFLRSCGFKDSFLSWIPLSAIENQNLVGAASDARLSSWYQGSNLLDAVDSLQPPVREISKPLRIPICDNIKSHSLGSVAASGKLEAGAIRCGLKVLVLPSGDLATVRYIERDSHACTIARAGDNVAVSLQGIDGNRVLTGGMLCHPDYPVAIATHLELKVLILDIVMPILIGSQLEFHVHHAKEAARVTKILSLFDQKTGKVSKKAPRCLTAKQSASIEVILDGAVCVEEFSDCRALGRVFLRASGRTVAVGIITRIIQ